MAPRIYIFDSHPVQYKAPVYQALHALQPDAFEVIYATDASVRKGHVDKEFGKEVAWDTPLLSGYRYRVLHNERGEPLSTPRSLTGRGVFQLLRTERPAAVLLTQSHYWFDHSAYLSALLLGIPVLIRQETQDEMFGGQRPWHKALLRRLVYRALYWPVQHAFVFGALNQQHLLAHGLSPERLSYARFSVPNPLASWPDSQREATRLELRASLGLAADQPDQWVIGFFGKLIPKKNPELIFHSLRHLPDALRSKLHLMFVGAGELQPALERLAQHALQAWGVRTSFVGFINQSRLPAYYLAADTVVLPSRRMGEAWGLVVNEALQAGCSVVISEAVGCAAEFDQLDRVKVIPVEDEQALARALISLIGSPRNPHWADAHMAAYSSEAAAQAMHRVFARYLA